MIETLSAYWLFLKRPTLFKLKQDKSKVWKDILWLLVLDYVFAGTIGFLYTILLHFNLITKYEQSFDLFKHGFVWALLLGAIFAPFNEELLFRWQLRKPKLSIWFVSISAALIMMSFTKSDYAKFFIFIGFLVIAIIVISFSEKLSRLTAIYAFRIYYIFLFYYTALVFGYIHISNIKGLTLADPSFLLYTGSQVFAGLTLGYIRVKYGLRYSIVMHACFNGIMIPIAWLTI